MKDVVFPVTLARYTDASLVGHQLDMRRLCRHLEACEWVLKMQQKSLTVPIRFS